MLRVRRTASTAMRDTACILAQTDVASVVRPVLDRRPVPPDDLHHLRVGVLRECAAGHVQAELLGLRRLALAERDDLAQDPDHLPAPDESDLLGRHLDADQPATFQAVMMLLPRHVGLRGEKRAGRPALQPSSRRHPDCL